MTISVLMATYAKENSKYLDESIKSIWTDQERKPDQIVLVEDGLLTQELNEIINKWQTIIGDKFTLLANNTNKGLALALNDGIKLCKGELIARMDSDDIAIPNRFKVQESYMEKHPDVEILGGSLEEFNDEGTLHKVRTYPQNFADIKRSIHKASPLGHPTVMFRNSLFKRGYRYSNQFFICEDVVLWYEALAGGVKINNIPDIVLKFRRNDSMMNRRGKKKAWSEFLAYTYGIHKLDGIFTIKYVYPCTRLLFRLMPSSIIKFIYNSKLRNVITHG